MSETAPLQLLQSLLTKLWIFAQRPNVQFQVIVIIVVTVVSVIASRALWLAVQGRLHTRIEQLESQRVRRVARYLVAIAKAATMPLFGLIGLAIALALRQNVFWDGLLILHQWFLWVVLAFEIITATFYTLFESINLRRYHYRLFVPLLVVVTIQGLTALLVDINALGDDVLFTISDNSITLGALFLVTVGLYLWINSVDLVHDIVGFFIDRSPRITIGSARATLTLFRYIFIIIGVVFAIGQLSLNPATVAAILGGLSVGVGFGLREILSNFISGILLLFERSLHPGDVLEMEDQLSVVQHVSIRATTVRTLDNIELIIPNQTFLTSSFMTYTGSDTLVRAPVIVTASCDNKLEDLISLISDTAEAHDEVLSDPAPSVFLLEFGDNVMKFQLNIWLDTPLKLPAVRSEVKRLLWAAFEEQNIDLTFPDLALHFQSPVQLQAVEPALAAAGG